MRTRALRPADAPALARLWRDTFPALVGTGPRAGAAQASSRVVEVAGDVVAAAAVTAHPGDPRARRLEVLGADPGAWAAAHDAAVAALRAEGTGWHVVVREDSHLVLPRLREAGYAVVARSWGAGLDVDEQVLAHLRGLRDRVVGGERGERGERGELRVRRLDAADAATVQALIARHRGDFPVTPATPTPGWSGQEAERLLAEADAFGLWDGDVLCALTVLRRVGPDAAETELTVTDARHRRCGFATAVKSAAVLALAEDGVQRFTTGGAQADEASLRANRRLGYVVGPLWLSLAPAAWTGEVDGSRSSRGARGGLRPPR